MNGPTTAPPDADPRGRFYCGTQYTTDPCRFGDCRGFSRLWDDGADPCKDEPLDGWHRGQIVRRSQPVFVLTQLGPPLESAGGGPGGPAGWRPNL